LPTFSQRWTRLLLAINLVVFALISIKSASLFNPTSADLLLFGAKDGALLAQGQWWRLISPIFLHVGIIHFLLNNTGLKYIGPFFESYLGARWFFAIYLLTGIIGNIASGFFNLGIGAGASGALFGLVGVGMVLEWRAYGQRRGFSFGTEQGVRWQNVLQFLRLVRTMPFSWLACINLAIALVFNFFVAMSDAPIGIDNAAHLGGMGGGILLAFCYLGLSSPYATSFRKVAAAGLFAMIISGIGVGAYVLCATDYLLHKYYRAATQTDTLTPGLGYLTQALGIDPNNDELRFSRGRLLALNNYIDYALADFSVIEDKLLLATKLPALIEELRSKGKLREAEMVEMLMNR
jgi:membrane associated rhomboid family serine protease